ncbi:MAG TPA: flagellin [Candidatus Acidoferrales bacterium]|nr:flagellin [Candidatus Acidoferrales bacterium]
MPTGLSIATNLLSNAVQLNLDNNQSQLQNVVTQLSSGLRINTAADDPSGNAIATNLTSQYEAFNQASQNVQNANNAAQVALGALTQQTDILQRIRVLAVEAASDVNSTSDRINLQAEVSQLLLEVNRIAQDTNFNGQALLNGSHQGDQGGTEAYYTITANAALLASGTQYGAGGAKVGKSTGFLISSVGIANAAFYTSSNTADETVEIQVVANSFNPTTATPRLEITIFNSSSAAVNSTTISLGQSSKFTLGSIGFGKATGGGIETGSGADSGVTLYFSTPTLGDIGETAYVKISQYVAGSNYATAPAFNFQSGANEGDVIQLGIAATNTNTLRISNINLAISSSTNPSLAAEDAIGQIDIALQTLTTQQADLGAVVVRLGIDQQNDNTAAVNLQASESNIADLNVGQATTEFTKLQLLVQVGTSVLAQSNANAQSVLTLFR